MAKVLWHIYLLLMLLLSACGESSDSADDQGLATDSSLIKIAESTVVSEADEAQLVAAMTDFSEAYFKAMVMVNSLVFADLDHMKNGVFVARLDGMLDAIDELAVAGAAMEAFEKAVIEPALVTARAAKSSVPTKAAVPNGDTPDLYHAQRLVDLWMNDDVFYQKYKLSDISKKTLVPMKRLRLMAEQIKDGIVLDELNLEADIADTTATRVEMIQAGATVAGSVLAIYSTGGAWAAATTTVQKGVVVLQGTTHVINITDTGLTFAYGDKERPAIVEKISTANKVTSILLGVSTLDGTKLNKAVTLIGSGLDTKDTYVKLTDDKKGLTVSDTPEPETKTPTQEERSRETFNDYAGYFLLPGDYVLPKAPLTGPEDLWDNSFLENTPNDVDAYVDAELGKIDDFVTTWNPAGLNPKTGFAYRYLDPAQTKGAVEKIVAELPAVVDPPALTVSADVTTGAAPLTVVFSATLEKADPSKTYSYSWSVVEDNVGANATDATLTHTFADPGNYTVSVTATTEGAGSLSASVPISVTAPAPWASITASPATATLNQQITFKVDYANLPTEDLVFKYDYSDGAMTEYSAASDDHRFATAGTYTAYVTVKDNSTGDIYATASTTVSVVPALVTGLGIEDKDSTSVSLTWTYSGSATFNIYVDGILEESTADTTLRVSLLEPLTYYCFRVSAVSGVTESALTGEVCTTTKSDFVNKKDLGPKSYSEAKSVCQAYDMRLPSMEDLKRLPAHGSLTYWSNESPFAGFYSVHNFATGFDGVKDSLAGETAYFACIY